jgi:hypothetical protein
LVILLCFLCVPNAVVDYCLLFLVCDENNIAPTI